MNIKNIVYVTQAQYDTLVNGGSITVEGVTYTYDDANVYAVKETIDTTPTQNSDNLVTSGGVYNALNDKENKHTVNYAVLLAASWTASGDEYTQTVSGSYISTNNDYIVDAPPTYESVYGYNGIKAVSMTDGTMTFTAKSLPTVDIQIRITNWG